MTSSQLELGFLLVVNLALISLSICMIISDRRLLKRLANPTKRKKKEQDE